MAAPKLVLCVIDAMAPAMLERAVACDQAPILARLMRDGVYVPDCVAAFPSVTPVCAASIVTGVGQDHHGIPSMNWYRREEGRYIEYGSSFRAAQRFGIAQQLTDTVYNMNAAHLSRGSETLFETLDDADLRTACTTYLIYRGRHRHEPQRGTALTRLASALIRHPVMGPRELFYADIFESRPTGCRSTLGMPGVRDRHSGCVSAYLVEHDLFDFLLVSLPDNDWHSHRHGPDAQVQSIAAADLQLARMMDAGGGVDSFLADHAVIVMADHSQAPITKTIDLRAQLDDLGVLGPTARRRDEPARIAVCPSQRAAMTYALDEEERDELRASVVARALDIEGVELAMWLEHEADGAVREAAITSADRRELRFAPGPEIEDLRGGQWAIEGSLETIGGELLEGRMHCPIYPDILARVWAALVCPASGDVLLSAAPGYEFLDWGGQAHTGGGSHGSLRGDDSLGALVMCGLERQPIDAPSQWSIRDIAPLIRGHFGVAVAD